MQRNYVVTSVLEYKHYEYVFLTQDRYIYIYFTVKYLLNLGSSPLTFVIYINSCFKFQRLLLKMYVEYIQNVKS